MPWKKRSLLKSKLYLILDTQVNDAAAILRIVRSSLAAGVDIVQLRDKKGSAKEILALSQKILKITRSRIPFILNDRVDLAIAAGAEGVHVGQDDLPLSLVRKMIGAGKIVGVSCQNLKQAKLAEREGADYIGFGSVFKTKTKPERDSLDLNLLADVVREIKIPVFAIGGIDLDNARRLQRFGVNRFAVCRAICEAKNVQEATRKFSEIITLYRIEGKTNESTARFNS